MLQQGRFFYNLSFLLHISGLLLFSFRAAVADISLGSKLTVVANDYWLSSNGDFAMGFFNSSNQPNQFSVGIRFSAKSIPFDKQTNVWVAGAGSVVGLNSYFQLTQNGGLVLFDSNVIVWRALDGLVNVVSAVLQDDGNFVLLDDKKGVLWQSFSFPSNTLIPGQKLFVSDTLRAASVNSVSSHYTLFVNPQGYLQLRWETSIRYWDSGSPLMNLTAAIFTSNGSLQLLNQNSVQVWSVFGEDHDDESVKLRFLRLDVDGNLRMYSWKKDLQSWKSTWQAVENQCNVHATCGKRGICKFNSSGTHECICPSAPTSSPNTECLLPDLQGCKSTTFVQYQHTSLQNLFPANASFFEPSLERCKLACLHDIHCAAVTFDNNRQAQCQMITSGYVNGYTDPSVGSVSFFKRCLSRDPLAVDFHVSRPSSSPKLLSFRLSLPCLIGVVSGTVVVFVLIHLGAGYFIYRRAHTSRRKAVLAYTVHKSKGLITFSFSEIKELSQEFNYRIGPKTFKGLQADKQSLVIKELDSAIDERKFRSRVSKIGHIHHKNLVKLKGYCCELQHRYLVYEYAKNGSVDKYIEDSRLCAKLTWKKRVEICSSVAKAICYLHTDCREFVNHGNLKCENVVLDDNFKAKVTDFGLGMFRNEASTYSLSPEKDVEDFGKLLLILVTGYQEVDQQACYENWSSGQLETETVDKRIIDGVNLEELERVLRIAFWCLQRDERMRPSMGEVVKVLEGTLSVDPPPPPFEYRRPVEYEDSSDSGCIEHV